MPSEYDYVVVGAGIVGLAVANEIKSRRPAARVAVLEKEREPGQHASGRNSGVLHCGIYYASDTVKAQVCAKGGERMMKFAQEHSIPFKKSGKVILATSINDIPTVDRLLRNAAANGIHAYKIGSSELREIEPHAAHAEAAVYCPDTAVIDSRAVLERLCSLLKQQGVDFFWGCEALASFGSNQLNTSEGLFSFGFLFNCAGAYADTLAKKFGLARDLALIPFKGIYWKLSERSNHLVRSNIYPVPDVSLPFLGVHLTRVISGDVYVGPTAIPALGRENYGIFQGAHAGEAAGILGRLAGMYFRNSNNFRALAHAELAKYSKSNFLSAAQQLVPSLVDGDLVHTPKAGIRPQLVNVRTHSLEMDYIFEQTDSSIHVLNSISPAFTSSLAFAEMIVDRSNAV
ncbi:MAG: L-2-hydroxyglutarate oxidase [Gallionella sp.]|nr:MAG: L-2-hydroxyglutarate oxidase [Gallionella sp.]